MDNNTGQKEKRCYTVKEVMEILGVCRPSVYKLIDNHEFRAISINGNKYRISKKSFDAWLDGRESIES